MSAFTKPTPLKAALKMGLYGPAGSGKTFTALLLAEGLARQAGKRVAFVDTEQGTSFYAQPVPQRAVHPEAFDFDILHSRSITEVLAALHGLDRAVHGVVVVDSISHLWDSCKNAFAGRTTKAGTIPMHAWAAIKRPYRELLNLLLALPVHVLICGRQGIDYGEDEPSGELKHLGYRMRAEGETAYEPDVLLRLESVRPAKKKAVIPVALVEKDRTGILAGTSIEWPTYASVAEPLLGLLGTAHTAMPTDEEVGATDAEALARQEREREQRSAAVAGGYVDRLRAAGSVAELDEIGRALTPAVKRGLVAKDLEGVRRAYTQRRGQLQRAAAEPGADGRADGTVLAGGAPA
jgi:hypothetical protein